MADAWIGRGASTTDESVAWSLCVLTFPAGPLLAGICAVIFYLLYRFAGIVVAGGFAFDLAFWVPSVLGAYWFWFIWIPRRQIKVKIREISLNNPRTQVLIALLVALALEGTVDAYFQSRRVPEPGAWVGGSAIFLGALIFAWYYLDSRARAFRRPAWLNVGVIAIAALAVPYYVVRSRPKGERFVALGRCLGFLLLSGVLYYVAWRCARYVLG